MEHVGLYAIGVAALGLAIYNFIKARKKGKKTDNHDKILKGSEG